jgi:thiol-disulfide isomerase/thioredoxin
MVKRTRLSLLLSLAITFCWLATGCGPAPGSAGKEKKLVPPLVLEKVEGGGSLSLAELKGKVLLIDLWATWCAPCLAELPHLQKLADTYDPKEFQMLGIVLESGERAEIQEFIRQKAIRYPNLLGQDGTKEAFGSFVGYPTKYLIDKEGYIVKTYLGVVGEKLPQDVQELVRTGTLSAREAGPGS